MLTCKVTLYTKGVTLLWDVNICVMTADCNSVSIISGTISLP